MDISPPHNSHNPPLALEVRVSGIDELNFLFQTATGETIAIPKTSLLPAASPETAALENDFKPGDSFTFQFKKRPSLEATIQQAQKQRSAEDDEKMRRLLEELIN